MKIVKKYFAGKKIIATFAYKRYLTEEYAW